VQRRRDTREHVALYVKAFNAWATGEPITGLRFSRSGCSSVLGSRRAPTRHAC
jgi:hypothetical protein